MKITGFILVLILSTCIDRVFPAKILSLEFVSSKSHKLTFLPLLEELGKRGHEITIVTPIPPFDPTKPMKNVREIITLDMEALDKSLSKTFDPFDPKSSQSTNPFLLLDFFSDICTQSMDLPQVQALLEDEFDLLFVQPSFNECLFGIVHKLKAPVILWSPMGVPSFLIEKIGGHFPPALTPNVLLGLPEDMTFAQRFFNFGFNLVFEGILKLYYEPRMTALYREKMGDNEIPSVTEIMRNQTAMILSNGHFSLHRPKPFFPDVVDVGGIHSRPAKPLPKDLEDFIKKGKEHGFIYFSMGSGLKGSKMPEERRKLFLSVFSKLKQQVLWKWETETMPDLPANVKLSKWLPQQDLLGHPQIKMFITHCGGGSTEEAVYHGCPLVGIPMFGDQPLNAKLAKSHGFIVELSWQDVTEERLMDAIQEVLNNPKYKANVQRISALYKDQPDDPLARGVYWIEYVLRHKGAPHLRSVGRNFNFFQYHSYDVIITYITIVILVLYLLYKLIRFIACKIVRYFSGKNVRKSEKRKPE